MSYTFPLFPLDWSGSKFDINPIPGGSEANYWSAADVNFLSSTISASIFAINDLSGAMMGVAWLTSSIWTPDGGEFQLTGSIRLALGNSFIMDGGGCYFNGNATAGDGQPSTVIRIQKHPEADITPGAFGDASRIRFNNNDNTGVANTFCAIEGHVNNPTQGSLAGRLSIHLANEWDDASSSPRKTWFTPDGITIFNGTGSICEWSHSGTADTLIKTHVSGGMLRMYSSGGIGMNSEAGLAYINYDVPSGTAIDGGLAIFANNNAAAANHLNVHDDVTGTLWVVDQKMTTGDESTALHIIREKSGAGPYDRASIRVGSGNLPTDFLSIPFHITASHIAAETEFSVRMNTGGGPRSGTISQRGVSTTMNYEVEATHNFYQQAGSSAGGVNAKMINVYAGGKGEFRAGALNDTIGATFRTQDAGGNVREAAQLYGTVTDATPGTFKSAVSLRALDVFAGTNPGVTVSASRVAFDNGASDIFQIRNFGVGNNSASLVTPAGVMLLSASHGVQVSGALEITGTAVTTLYLHSPNGARWAVTCSNAGVLGVVSA